MQCFNYSWLCSFNKILYIYLNIEWTYQETMKDNHPSPTSIWRILILDLFLFLLLCGHGILPEQVHGCLGFT